MSFAKFITAIIGDILSASNQPKKPKTYPVLTKEMFTNSGPIGTAEAKKLYKQFMVDIGYLEKDEATEYAGAFADAMNEHLEYLQADVRDAKEALAEAKKEANDFEGLTKEEIIEAKADIPQFIEWEQNELTNAQAALAKFKTDKRDFMIEYINGETQNHH